MGWETLQWLVLPRDLGGHGGERVVGLDPLEGGALGGADGRLEGQTYTYDVHTDYQRRLDQLALSIVVRNQPKLTVKP